jgi:hypothetical protein
MHTKDICQTASTSFVLNMRRYHCYIGMQVIYILGHWVYQNVDKMN